MSNTAPWSDQMIIGMGVDIVHIPRIEKAVLRFGEHFTSRIFTKDEIDYCLQHKKPYQCLALRFAAKEACSKALGTGIGRGIGWHDIFITNMASGRPILNLTGTALQKAQDMKARLWHVTLSHETLYGIAIVIIE
ncbi:MAG: holo-ACP synthase [Dissulfurimicrobium sp.]|uniref:holo-ACP synthase n=1 Tax=Dissulfurimicrobium sp. TaxID=2022436 RepID=UPI00404B5B1D